MNYLLNIDVLGFGDFVDNNSLDTVMDFYSKIITGADYAGNLIDSDKMELMVYSDTIAVKSNHKDKNKCLFDLIKLANMIQVGQYYSALSKESLFLPVRGTITYGDFVFHKGDIWTQAPGRKKVFANNINLIIGKPIVESYRFEKEMDLICVAISDSVLKADESSYINQLVETNLLLEYNIPLKKDKKKKGFVINPVFSGHLDFNIEKLEYEKEKFKGNDKIEMKYINILNLLSHIKDNELFYPKVEI